VPTNRKYLRRSHRATMDAQQAMELWLGPNRNIPPCFTDDSHRVEVWFKFRDQLMQQWGRHGRRPLAWWIFEKRWRYPGSEHERSLLYEADLLTHDLLTPEERSELEAYWREEFDKTQTPGFWCYHEGKIVTGIEAPQRHWIFIDLPPKFLDRLLAERGIGAEEPAVA